MGLPDDPRERQAEQESGQIFSPDQLIHVTIDGEDDYGDDADDDQRRQQQEQQVGDDDAQSSDETTPLVASITPIQGGIYGDPDNINGVVKPSAGEPAFQDPVFAVLWILQFLAVLYLGIFVAPLGYDGVSEQIEDMNITAMLHEIPDQNDDLSPEDKEEWAEMFDQLPTFLEVYVERIVTFAVLPAVEAAVIMSLVKIFFLFAPCARNVVRGSLIMTLLLALVFAISNVINSSSWVLPTMVSGLVLAGVSFFVYKVWPLVPFATINLRIALKAISFKNNCGAFIWGILLTELCCYWVCFWFYTSFGTLNIIGKDCGTSSSDAALIEPQFSCTYQGWVFLFFLISLYWTTSVCMVRRHIRILSPCSSLSLVTMFLTLSFLYMICRIPFKSLLQVSWLHGALTKIPRMDAVLLPSHSL